MSSANFAAVAAMRQLAGRELPRHRRIADLRAAIERLETATRAWPAFEPRGDALEQATGQADAIARGLRELRASKAGGID